jgi:hypothetical protein
MARRGINPKLNALSTIMFTAVLLLLLIVNLRQAREEKKGRRDNEQEKGFRIIGTVDAAGVDSEWVQSQ